MDLLLHNLRTIGTHHCDQTVGVEAAEEIEWMRATLAALIAEADSNPFCPIGHWVEHGAAAEMLRAFRETCMPQRKTDAK
ncbi:hypothetical protein [Pelomicrobium sp. G1]|uniref:hypothetical protein n=1 Tax=unclassified Pelomicrobium TaxID=2815318 RepID=UPI003F769552